LTRTQKLAVFNPGKPGGVYRVGHDNGGGNYGPGQGATPDFINTGYKLVAFCEKLLFFSEGWCL